MSQSNLFDLEADYEELNNGVPEDYTILRLKDFDNGEIWTGKPVMGSPYTYEFEDKYTSEMVKKVACKLSLINDELEQALEINFNLKKEDDNQTNIFKKSILFDFIAGLRELEEPGCMTGFNRFKKLNLKSIRDVVNEWDSITIEVKDVTSGDYAYKSLKILEAIHNLE